MMTPRTTSILFKVPALAIALAFGGGCGPRGVDRQAACVNNLKVLYAAKEIRAKDYKIAAQPAMSDLFQVPGFSGIPVCPGDGRYTLGDVGAKPQCTMAGHTLE
jgi:hypothetical protein